MKRAAANADPGRVKSHAQPNLRAVAHLTAFNPLADPTPAMLPVII